MGGEEGERGVGEKGEGERGEGEKGEGGWWGEGERGWGRGKGVEVLEINGTHILTTPHKRPIIPCLFRECIRYYRGTGCVCV